MFASSRETNEARGFKQPGSVCNFCLCMPERMRNPLHGGGRNKYAVSKNSC